MPFFKQGLQTTHPIRLNASKSSMSNTQNIMAVRGEAFQKGSVELKLNNDKPLAMDTIVDKPKRKRRRKRNTASHLVGGWRAPARQRKTKPPPVDQSTQRMDENGERVIKRRRRRNETLTSPQRASLRQLISKRRISILEVVESLRAVEFTQNPQRNLTDCNKILFAASLELLPSLKIESDDDSADSGFIRDLEGLYETDWSQIHNERLKANEILKKKIETVHDAWKAMVLNDYKWKLKRDNILIITE